MDHHLNHSLFIWIINQPVNDGFIFFAIRGPGRVFVRSCHKSTRIFGARPLVATKAQPDTLRFTASLNFFRGDRLIPQVFRCGEEIERLRGAKNEPTGDRPIRMNNQDSFRKSPGIFQTLHFCFLQLERTQAIEPNSFLVDPQRRSEWPPESHQPNACRSAKLHFA